MVFELVLMKWRIFFVFASAVFGLFLCFYCCLFPAVFSDLDLRLFHSAAFQPNPLTNIAILVHSSNQDRLWHSHKQDLGNCPTYKHNSFKKADSANLNIQNLCLEYNVRLVLFFTR